MIVIISVSVLAIILTYLETHNGLKSGMKIGFILLTIVASIQFCVGSDYISYYNNYLEVSNSTYSYTLEDALNGKIHNDTGWSLLIWLFSFIDYGFFWLVALLAVIENSIYYNFIHKNVDKKWWTLSVFLYTICTSMYLMNFSMFRQAFVDAIFLACWPLIINKKWLQSLIILFICTFIHSSATIILPFAFWGYLPLKNTKLLGFAYAGLLLALYLFGGLVNDIVAPFFNMEEFKHFALRYENDKRTVGFGGLGFWIYLIPVALTIAYFITNKTNENRGKSIVAISAIGSLILPFGTVMPMIGRLANYFVAFRLCAYPIIYQSVKNIPIRIILLWLIIMITIYDYYIFFNDPIWVSYTKFRTIFEVIKL